MAEGLELSLATRDRRTLRATIEPEPVNKRSRCTVRWSSRSTVRGSNAASTPGWCPRVRDRVMPPPLRGGRGPRHVSQIPNFRGGSVSLRRTPTFPASGTASSDYRGAGSPLDISAGVPARRALAHARQGAVRDGGRSMVSSCATPCAGVLACARSYQLARCPAR
jgi:hypothetical protein